ncbi:peptidoglycan-binding domain-containing protein [Streptomyces sp. NPDC001348]
MSTPPEQGPPHRGPVLEPIRVLRPRRLDTLAELMREMEEDAARPQPPADRTAPDARNGPSAAHAFAGPPPEDDTEELPAVSAHPSGPSPAAPGRFGFGPGLRRAAVAVAVTAASLVGFGCALLLPGREDTASAAQPERPATTAPAAPAAPTTPAAGAPTAADPDGAGTLRQGDSGPEVAELQQRLLRIPDVYRDGSTSGHYDASLTAAVARFQVWYGISGDERGVYGDDTRRSLESRTSLTTG